MLRKNGRRVIKVQGHEIKDADISHISLVKRGANRIPFAIVKNENDTLYFEFVKSEAAKRGIVAKSMTRILGDQPVEQIALFKADKFVGWALPNGDIRRDLMGSEIKKGSFQAPATGGEEANDSAKNQAERARVAQQRALERRVEELKSERTSIEWSRGDLANKQRVMGEITVEIAALERAILDIKGGEVKKADALDLLTQGRATAFEDRGGQSMTVDAGPLPTEISKASADFWADLASEVLGVKRPRESIVKGGVEIPLSDPFGIRNKHLLGR